MKPTGLALTVAMPVGGQAVSRTHRRSRLALMRDCNSGHRDAQLLRGLHCLHRELGAATSQPTACRCEINRLYVPIKSLMDRSIVGMARRTNMTCRDDYEQSPGARVNAA